MDRIRALEGSVRHYEWGSREALARLQGRPAPSAEPEAELWLGAHPEAPARVQVDGERMALDAWIARDPEQALGARLLGRGQRELPFLLKVLAVAAPLSLQAHPDAEQAREGFAREERAGRRRDDPARSYRDPHPKPELVCALTPFEALKGFRRPQDIRDDLARLDAPALRPVRDALEAQPDPAGWRLAFERLLALGGGDGLEAVVEAARAHPEARWRWLVRLAAAHPGDPGVLAPLYLNHLRLAPGEAIFLPARELHCYLEGLAVEIMANSDNVLRGGLTRKHVDRSELLRVMRFAPGEARPVAARRAGAGGRVWPVPADQFELARHELATGSTLAWERQEGPEILLCTGGCVRVSTRDGAAEAVEIASGAAAWVPAGAGRGLRIEGGGTLFRASVP